MAKIKPFKAIRPTRDKAYLLSSKPAYTYKKNLLEAKLESNPYTFLHVINPEFGKNDKSKPNSIERFQKVKSKFNEFCDNGFFLKEDNPCIYIYQQITPTNIYTGVITGASVDDYINGTIKIHEQTITEREKTFFTYLDVCQFNAEPVLLTYKDNQNIDKIISKYLNTRSEYEFHTTEHKTHYLWVVDNDKDIQSLILEFEKINQVYIADGHHRTASSVLYAKAKRKDNFIDGNFNYFLAFYIAESKLKITAFNRIIKSLNNLSISDLLQKIKVNFDVKEVSKPARPENQHEFTMYLDKKWFQLVAKTQLYQNKSIVETLDTQILFKNIISPILGIKNQKTDDRIDFIDANLGLKKLKNMVDDGKAKIAFSLYPVTINQLKQVADANEIMPPKSTYIEPKLRSGLTIYDLNE